MREQLTDFDIDRALTQLVEKLEFKLKEKGRGIFVSRHEMDGVIDEEVREFKDAVRSGTSEECVSELIDIGVAALVSLASYANGNVEW